MLAKVNFDTSRWALVSSYVPASKRNEKAREFFGIYPSERIESFAGQNNMLMVDDLSAIVEDVSVDYVVGWYGVPGRNDGVENLVCARNRSWWGETTCTKSVMSTSKHG